MSRSVDDSSSTSEAVLSPSTESTSSLKNPSSRSPSPEDVESAIPFPYNVPTPSMRAMSKNQSATYRSSPNLFANPGHSSAPPAEKSKTSDQVTHHLPRDSRADSPQKAEAIYMASPSRSPSMDRSSGGFKFGWKKRKSAKPGHRYVPSLGSGESVVAPTGSEARRATVSLSGTVGADIGFTRPETIS